MTSRVGTTEQLRRANLSGVLQVLHQDGPRSRADLTRIIGLNMTYDGFIAAAAPGAVAVLDRNLNLMDFVVFEGEAVTTPNPHA